MLVNKRARCRYEKSHIWLASYVLMKHYDYDLMYELIKAVQITSNVICITEICIKNQPLSNLDLPNYNFFHGSTTTNAAGVTTYISDNLKYKVCEN